ncbi:MAG: methyltransferase domain-containing protein [Candidatus Eremiobacteraeota bacterium]|nr:methyltransferase domain-containing protein [Candidatus Eremiobacteraeota bacterium]
MSASESAFAGSIPELYERHLGPMLFAPFAADLTERARTRAPRRVLEVAAGTGIVTRALHAAFPGADIVATDLNEGMIALGARRLAAPNVTWRQADAGALPFADAEFDLVVCQFGAMFFPDRARAFAEVFRVLVPGGRLLLSMWSSLEFNEIPRIVARVAADAFPSDPPTFIERVPHGHGDADVTTAALRAAGFSTVGVEIVELPSRAPSAADAAIGFCQGSPLRMEIEARDAARLHEITDATAAAMTERFGPGPIEAPMRALVFDAVK